MKNMNRFYVIFIMLMLPIISFAQVIIGDDKGTAPADRKKSVLLEFANTNNKGIILPYVTTKVLNNDSLLVDNNAVFIEGSLILDVTDPSEARVKYYAGKTNDGEDIGWFDLSGQSADISEIVASQRPMQQSNVKDSIEEPGYAIIGDNNSSVKNAGVLILESETKAMVLPHVDDVNKIINPSPGMLVYVNKNGAKRLAVFNGRRWSFWKP